jgi:thiamine kinase-like enzyme
MAETTTTTPTIEDVIAAIPAWAAATDVRAEAIPAGLTNHNYRVTVDGTPFFVRVPGPGGDLLAVDRGNEVHNTRAAAAAGVGPAMVHHLPAWDVFALAWLEARTMSNERFAAMDDAPERVAASLRRLHAGPRFRDDFDMVRTTERYIGVVDGRGFPIPHGYRDGIHELPRIEAALAAHPLPTVPCHNDLLAENYLDDGERLWIVDYEYSGNNDPTFELGNTCQELGWGDDRIERLCRAYFGEATERLLARMRLQMIMSDLGWTLWAAIQAAISPIEYDFMGWAEERWGRARAALGGPDYEGWLRAVR